VATSVALYTQYLTLQEAVAMAIGDWVSPDQRDIVRNIVATYDKKKGRKAKHKDEDKDDITDGEES
jgi:hypothetical protein